MPAPIRKAPPEESHRPICPEPRNGNTAPPARISTAPARSVVRIPHMGRNSRAEMVAAIGQPMPMEVRVRPETMGERPSTAWM